MTLVHSVAKILNHFHCKSIVVVNLYLRPGSFHCRGLFRFQVVPPELSYFMSAQGCLQLQAPADCVQGASATCRESRQKGRLVVAGAAVREAPRSGTPGVSQSKNVRLAYKLPGQASRHRASTGFCPRETQAAEQRHRRRGMSTTDFQSLCQQVCRAVKAGSLFSHMLGRSAHRNARTVCRQCASAAVVADVGESVGDEFPRGSSWHVRRHAL